MDGFKSIIRDKKNILLTALGIALLFAIALILLFAQNSKSVQSVSPSYPSVYFEGEYRIGAGEWRKISAGEHISATKGDVTLRGMFHMLTPNGEYIGPVPADTDIAFYLDHINVTVLEDGQEPYMMDNENPIFGASSCCKNWVGYSLRNGDAETLEILIHNPHIFGNETAVDELISNLSLWVNIDFERNVLDSEFTQRNTGVMFVIISFVLLGIAFFSSLLHIAYNKFLWSIGLATAFAGGYLTFSLKSITFWSDSYTTNTSVLCMCMMFYMFFVILSSSFLLDKTRKVAVISSWVLGFSLAVFFMVPIFTSVYFYDILPLWVIVQSIANIVLTVCLIKEFTLSDTGTRYLCVISVLPLISFEIDAVATAMGLWKGGFVSKIVFVILFILVLVAVVRIIPHSLNATMKARKLEVEKNALDAELAQSRISTMISQIRPHFIYNTLGSIEQLCELDPPKAGELVRNFAKYLRGNFGELDNPNPILMSKEMQHVRHYINIENTRFPDMTFKFEMNCRDFYIPALTIQPLVENAIKHGLMKLQKGGSITVISYETDTHYVVSVEDNGVGFDTGILLDERKHVGLRNIRGRLEAIVGGTLEINSTIGVGTKVLIKIPKEMEK